MPWKREPVSTRLLPVSSGEVAVVICGCQSGRINPSPISYSSALRKKAAITIPLPPAPCRWAATSPCE